MIRKMKLMVLSALVVWMVVFCFDKGQCDSQSAGTTAGKMAQAFQVWTENALIKVQKDSIPSGRTTLFLKSAKNEFELAHLVIRANMATLSGVDVRASDLANGEDRIPSKHIRLYLERFLKIENRSNVEGVAGYWPDPLIPREDIFFSEKRNGFPFAVAAMENQPVLVEVYVPEKTKSGVYRGSLEIIAQGHNPVVVPLELKVFNFTLPSTSSLQTSYSTSLLNISKGFHKEEQYSDKGIFELVMKDFLLHRISPRIISWQSHAPYQKTGDTLNVDWSKWTHYWAPFFEGTALRHIGVLPDAKFATWNLLVDTVPPEDQIAYADEQVGLFQKQGWTQFLYRKVFDEPEKIQYLQVHTELERWDQMKKKVPLLVTTSNIDEFSGGVTLWCDVVNSLHRSDDISLRGQRDRELAVREKRGEHLWWYQSCRSTGCFIDGKAPKDVGWPSVAIDQQGMYQRIMPWLTWMYDIQGELYYEVAEKWYIWDGKDGSKNDPWLNFDHFRLNGDGRLFYPGTIERIGGTHPIPIESLRLKLLRDGYEDYEYFVLMKKLEFETELNNLIAKLVKRNNNWEKDPTLLMDLRNQMGELISKSCSRLENHGK